MHTKSWPGSLPSTSERWQRRSLKSHDQSQTRTCTPIARVIWREALVRATVYAGVKLDLWASLSIGKWLQSTRLPSS